MRQVNRTGFRNAFAHLAILTIISGEFLHCFLRPESFVKSTILKLLGIISGIILIKLLLRIQTKNPQCQHPIGYAAVFYTIGIVMQMISIHTVSTAEINPFWSAIPILFAAAQLFICFESQLLGLMIASVTLLPIIRLFAFYHATTAIALLLAGLITLAVITMVSNKRHLLLMSGVFIALAAIMFLLGPNPVEMLTQALEPRFEFAHDTIPNILAAPGSDPAMTSPFTDLKATEYLSWCDNCFMLSEVVARFGLAKVLFVCTPLIGMLLTGGVVAVVSKDTYSTARVISYVSLAAPTILYFLQNLGVETVILNEVPLLTSGFMGSMLSTILVWQISVPESMLPAGDRRMYRIPAKVQAWFNGELEDEDDDDEDEE